MSKYAMMNGDEVINVALWDGETPWEPGCEIVELPDDSPVGPGWVRNGGEWVAPPLSPEQQALLDAMQASE
jgi:hypothetical protein